MYDVNENFLRAIEQNDLQFISGKILMGDGEPIYLDGKILNNVTDEVSYSRQCTAVETEFGIGQLYTGNACITLISAVDREKFRGKKMLLNFTTGGQRIPLGVWTITDPQRISHDKIRITAVDCIGLLDVPIVDNAVGAISLEARLRTVKNLTGVEFAQTAEEIQNLIGYEGLLFGTEFCKTCRGEVAAIAEFMGGIAYADRFGRIAFRKFGTSPVLTISAEMRHDISLNEYTFGVRGVAYTDKYGHTTVHEIEGGNVSSAAVLSLSDNPFFMEKYDDDSDAIDRQYRYFLRYAAANLWLPDWVPGEVQYYGNPALDLGDMVEISGGINGKNGSTLFLITAEHWQFRGVHTLISAGAADRNFVVGASGTSASQQMFTQINVTKNIAVIDFDFFENALENDGKIIADCIFSAREETEVFADISLNLRGIENAETQINLYLDDEILPAFFVGNLRENESCTAHFSCHFSASSGMHTLSMTAIGNAEISGKSAYIWGQNIVETSPRESASDYEYEIVDETVTILRYIGISQYPKIPQEIEDFPVKKIASGAFVNTAVVSVIVPEGVEEIE